MSLSFFKRKKDIIKSDGLPSLPSFGHSIQPAVKENNNSERRLSRDSISGVNHNACYSHRNVKHSHQMLIAENMHDPTVALNTKSRLCPTLSDVLNDNNSLGYFVQFMEAEGTVPKNMIKFWLQVECLRKSLTTCASSDNKHPQEKFIEDAVRIFSRFLETGKNQSLNLDLSDSLKKSMEDQLFKHKIVSADMFDEVQSQMLIRMDSEFYEKFLKSSYFCKYKIDILTDGSVCTSDILFNDSTLFYFMDFMEQEGMKHTVDFLLMAANCRQCGNQSDAQVLYDRYFSHESSNFLEMSDKIKCHVQMEITTASKTCFDLPMGILLQYLEKTYFRQFLQSQTYINYLTECINSLQTLSLSVNKKNRCHRRQNSDSSNSENYSNPGSHNPQREGHSTDPCTKAIRLDSLWKRDLAGKLQIAHVNRYGKLLSDFEPEPERSGSLSAISLTKAVRRLTIGSSDDKEKEDLAWRVAEMIVNDVCHVTQMHGLSNSS